MTHVSELVKIFITEIDQIMDDNAPEPAIKEDNVWWGSNRDSNGDLIK